jgi:chromosome segregation ATPase
MVVTRRYVKEKGARRLQECGEKIDEHQARIGELALAIEQARDAIALIDKEINEGGASVANLRENIRVRKLVRDVKSTQAEIDSHDMEEAAKARRTFAERYQVEKDKETEMQSSVCAVHRLEHNLRGMTWIFPACTYRRRIEFAEGSVASIRGGYAGIQRHQ